jgi:hypothetical protein
MVMLDGGSLNNLTGEERSNLCEMLDFRKENIIGTTNNLGLV